MTTFSLGGCASVPKEAVTLSTTVGRDIAEVHRAHYQIATILFSRMRSDINRFVDQVYVPYQIKAATDLQWRLARSENPEDQKKSLFILASKATQPEAPAELQVKTQQAFTIFTRAIQEDVDKMRADLIAKIDVKEREVLGAIDRAYLQIHYANSIVTGHLSSILSVHDAQEELLKTAGIETDLRELVGNKLSKTSAEIQHLVETSEQMEGKVDEVRDKLKETINSLNK